MYYLTYFWVTFIQSSRWTLIFGDTDLSTRSDDFDVATRRIDRAHFHPKWDRYERIFKGNFEIEPFSSLDRSGPYYDVAIWEVRPITFGLYVRPICLPQRPNNDYDSYVGRAAETMGEVAQLTTHFFIKTSARFHI